MDLVRDLADECQDEALALILEAEGESGRKNQSPGRGARGRRLATLASAPRTRPTAEALITNDRVSALDRLGQNP